MEALLGGWDFGLLYGGGSCRGDSDFHACLRSKKDYNAAYLPEAVVGIGGGGIGSGGGCGGGSPVVSCLPRHGSHWLVDCGSGWSDHIWRRMLASGRGGAIF